MPDRDGAADRIATALRVEQEALERLVYALEMQRMVLDAARVELLAEAGRDVERALKAVRRADLLRAVSVASVHLSMAAGCGASGVWISDYPTLGRIVAAASRQDAARLVSLSSRLKKTLARALALADHNGARMSGARDRLADDELALWSDSWTQQFAETMEGFLEEIDHPSSAAHLLDDVERVLFEEDDEQLAAALAHLRLQAISFEAALGVLQTVGCRPLLEFIDDVDPG